ncbi:SpoIVB peptidase S55 domain-containing protein [Nocardioides sp. cx-173]|uniref:SpoIVB peptidase S55 domain-containing protein n=1 Tax=Nocardioides sp. cx-173 TaxID=2898796 RepID=UPI001E349AEE|nr:SpoIVB peptidase S55 domain-containing protein [Nocardioides sp. cx-173]MCD4526842.1 hypothetical protein [Nocardioides sp. cx-173]UGB43943.1 hypothetical protein LQ940_10600 [Nocardioides sp. cx-173]
MSLPTVQRRGATLVALASTLGLLLAAPFTTSPAVSVPPAGDCTAAFPLDEVAAGQVVRGLTVESGVTPQPFDGEVLGVLDDGIGAGVDMIMMSLDSPAIQRAGGIWQGMSGSPVYDAADGRLIGAVAYGLSYGPSPIAGITPFEDMDDYLASAAQGPGRVRIGPAMAKRIAQHSDVTARQAAQGARHLPMPLGVSGISAHRLAAAKQLPYVTKDAYVAGRASSSAVPADIVAGGNIAASVAYGDVTLAGVGTATQVCDGRVVGFGHPMYFSGPASMSMHPAEAIYVQPDSLGAPFKVANLSAPAGTITDDRLTGITGTYEVLPKATTVTSDLTMGARHRVGSTQVTEPRAAAEATFYQLIGNHDRVVDGAIAGTETQSWRITGRDASGKPFGITVGERFTSREDITYEASVALADLVYAFTTLPGVTVDAVTSTGAVTTSTATYRLRGVQQLRQGQWVPLGRKEPALAKAGRKLYLRAVLSGPAGQKLVRSTFIVPKRASGMRGMAMFEGGGSIYSEGVSAESLPGLLKQLKGAVRNDELTAALGLSGRGPGIERSQVLGPVGLVVEGFRQVRVIVR